jgi:hypothetical protein
MLLCEVIVQSAMKHNGSNLFCEVLCSRTVFLGAAAADRLRSISAYIFQGDLRL